LQEKLTKFWNFTRLHNKTTRSRPGRGQNLEAEAKASRPRPKFWPRGLNITGCKLYLVLDNMLSNTRGAAREREREREASSDQVFDLCWPC